MFDFETLRYNAKMLASKPFVQRPVDVPEALLKLSYDQYRDIRFKSEEAVWRREHPCPSSCSSSIPGFSFEPLGPDQCRRGQVGGADLIRFTASDYLGISFHDTEVCANVRCNIDLIYD